MNPAFIFVDMLEDFFAKPPLSGDRSRLGRAANELAAVARRSGFPVIWVRQQFAPDLSDAFTSMRETGTRITIQGTKGSSLIAELQQLDGDLEVIKKRYSAFFKTELAHLLDDLSCSHVIIGGVNTHACVRATAVDAFQLDYHVILAKDAIASYDEEYHRESLRYMEQSIGVSMSNHQIEEAVSGA